MISVLPEVCDNAKVLVRGGNSSFWYDRWLVSGPLLDMVDTVPNPALLI